MYRLGYYGRIVPAWLSWSILWLSVLIGGFLACAEADSGSQAEDHGSPAYGRGVYVPAEWRTVRNLGGHEIHVVRARVACNQCHAFTETSVGEVSPARCADCHAREARLGHAEKQAKAEFGEGVSTNCMDCHAFVPEAEPAPRVHDSPLPEPTDCMRCHAQAEGQTPAVVVHGQSECVTCHRVHEADVPEPRACAKCHAEISTQHAAHGKDVTQVCTTCHQHQHAPGSDALEHCADCHHRQQPIVSKRALFSGGHSQCVDCHRPHDFARKQAVSCRSCHADVRVLGAGHVAAHADCQSCHAPHDVKQAPTQACVKCHGNVHPDHPTEDQVTECVGCHDLHPAAAHAEKKARACSDCHQTAASDQAFHGQVGCTQCHRAHDFAIELGDHQTCNACHSGPLIRTAKLAGHQQCQSCHSGLPHHPERPLVACETCHAEVKRAAHIAHQNCSDCHEPHGGSLTTACRSCHTTEHATAPLGHRECLNCHQPHTGNTSSVSCDSCHQSQASSAHGGLPQGCTTCHRPHGPIGPEKPPACSSCHQASDLEGLHAESKHRACSSCHSGHGRADQSDRATCLSCHTAQTAHFPEAKRCTGCHLF